jgi:hypothetical protein
MNKRGLRKILSLGLASGMWLGVTLPNAADSVSVATAKVAPDSTLAHAAKKDSTSKHLARADTIVVVKHQFNHREQIITGSVIMACLAGMFAIMNNYNPR